MQLILKKISFLIHENPDLHCFSIENSLFFINIHRENVFGRSEALREVIEVCFFNVEIWTLTVS